MQLNTAQMCAKRVRPANSQIIRPLLNLESPNSTQTSTPTYSTGQPDMTSPPIFGRHWSKSEKRPEMPPPTTLGRTKLVTRRFAWPNQLVSFLFQGWDGKCEEIIAMPCQLLRDMKRFWMICWLTTFVVTVSGSSSSEDDGKAYITAAVLFSVALVYFNNCFGILF